MKRRAVWVGILWLSVASIDAAAAGYFAVDLGDADIVETGVPGAHDPVDRYTVGWVRDRAPQVAGARRAYFVDRNVLSFFPRALRDSTSTAQSSQSPILVLAEGVFTLEELEARAPGALQRRGSSYHLSQPLYIGPLASLRVAGETLGMAPGTFVFSHGTLFVLDASIRALPGPPRARPFLLSRRGSSTYIANSHLEGLGYSSGHHGTTGLTIDGSTSESGFGLRFSQASPPTAWLIGNNIRHLSIGVHLRKAGAVVAVGNVVDGAYRHALRAAMTEGALVIARNVFRGTKISHGLLVDGLGRTWIGNNWSEGNAGAGFALSGPASRVSLVGNLAAGNDGNGISLFESSGARVHGCLATQNRGSGIALRNSTATLVSNHLDRNDRDGIRAFVTDDAARGVSQNLVLAANHFEKNAKSAFSANGVDSIILGRNEYDATGVRFAGEVSSHAATIVRHGKDGSWVRLERRVAP